MATLVIRPKSGKFLKNADFFSKMDPWVKITVGTESQRTETHYKAGTTPFWKSTLNFKLSNQQLAQSDSILLSIEAFDEDGPNKHEFLGSTIFKLTQLTPNKNELFTLTLLDKKNKTAGTVEMEFELQTGMSQSSRPSALTTTTGEFIVKPISGKFLKDVDFLSGMDPFVSVTIGTEKQRTETHINAGKYPIWKTALVFRLNSQQLSNPDSTLIVFEALDEDKKQSNFLGSASYKLSQVRSGEVTTIHLVDRKDKPVGTIDVEFNPRDPTNQALNQAQLQAQEKERLQNQTTAQIQAEEQRQARLEAANRNKLQSYLRTSDTIVFRPKAGNFLRNADTFSKMDPLVRITVDSVANQTETAYKQGKTPTWKTPLPFRLNRQQIAQPEQVLVTFEAFDEDGKNKYEFLGKVAYRLTQLDLERGETITLQLVDKKEKPAGTIDVEFDVEDSVELRNKRNTELQNLFRAGDTLVFKPKSGKFLKDSDTFSKMDPFVKVSVDGEAQRTETANNAGKTPTWRVPLGFKISNQQLYTPENVVILFEAFDEESKTKNEFLGMASYRLSNLYFTPGQVTQIPLFDTKEKQVGTIDVEFDIEDSNRSRASQSLQYNQNSQNSQQDKPKNAQLPSSQSQSQSQYSVPNDEATNKRNLVNLFNTGDTIVFKPRAGNFAKNADLLSKMDPFVQITVDVEPKRTETAQNGGKNPTWKTPLAFKLNEQQLHYPENVLVKFEAYDEDSKTKSELLGYKAYRLTQMNLVPGEPIRLQLEDSKDRPVGTIDVDWEIQDSRAKSNELVIRPRAGKFLKDADTFGKMDPFVKVTIGFESQKTETALNAGKTPTWKTPLTFKFTNYQIANPENIVMNVEAFDEDSKTSFEFLGSNTLKLSQVRRGETFALQLFDKKNKLAGTIDLDIDVVQVSKPIIGTIAVKPTSARFDSGVYESQRFYLVFTHGETSYQSLISEGNGRRPTFKDIISFQLFDNEDLVVRCFDNDDNNEDMIAETVLRPSTLAKRGELHNLTLPLTTNGKKIGELDLEVEFYQDVFQNPVRVYPILGIRRSEYISKKMKYSNPDRFRKNLLIRSYDSNLVTVKTERVTVNPQEFIEIRFKILAPQRSNEDRCRVDIVIEESGVVEESLLFKIRSI